MLILRWQSWSIPALSGLWICLGGWMFARSLIVERCVPRKHGFLFVKGFSSKEIYWEQIIEIREFAASSTYTILYQQEKRSFILRCPIWCPQQVIHQMYGRFCANLQDRFEWGELLSFGALLPSQQGISFLADNTFLAWSNIDRITCDGKTLSIFRKKRSSQAWCTLSMHELTHPFLLKPLLAYIQRSRQK